MRALSIIIKSIRHASRSNSRALHLWIQRYVKFTILLYQCLRWCMGALRNWSSGTWGAARATLSSQHRACIINRCEPEDDLVILGVWNDIQVSEYSRRYLQALSINQFVLATVPGTFKSLLYWTDAVEGVFCLFITNELLFTRLYFHRPLFILDISENSTSQYASQVWDEVESLLSCLNHVGLVIIVRKLPLNMAAWLDEHEWDLVREVALTNCQD